MLDVQDITVAYSSNAEPTIEGFHLKMKPFNGWFCITAICDGYILNIEHKNLLFCWSNLCCKPVVICCVDVCSAHCLITDHRTVIISVNDNCCIIN